MPAYKNAEPPLVDLKITNPLTYIKRWWQRIIGNEGMELRFRIRPLTAIAIAVIVSSLSFGVGRFVLPVSLPFFKYTPQPFTLPTPPPWRETAFTGTVQFSSQIGKYYLIISSSEAITLEVPANIDLKNFINRRIFAAGSYNKSTRTLLVADASDLELLPKKPIPIPTTPPTPPPSAGQGTPTPTPDITITPPSDDSSTKP
mgnify:CR=1 FL=1